MNVYKWWASDRGTSQAAIIFLLNGFVAFFVNVCNVKTTKLTSALTVSSIPGHQEP